MATDSNVYSQGAGGVFYENAVQTGFFVSFLLGLTMPGTADGKIVHFRQQAGSMGFETDDLLLDCLAGGQPFRILMQIKHQLTISEGGEEFGKVITAAWKDFNNTALFDPQHDKIFIVKSDLTLDEKKHLLVLLDWARAKATPADLKNEAGKIKGKQKYYALLKSVIQRHNPDDTVTDEQYFHFLRSLYVPELDYDIDNSQQRIIFLSLIDNFKKDAAVTAKQIWQQIASHLQDTNSKGGSYRKESLANDWKDLFNATQYQQDVKQLRKFAERKQEELIANIKDTIGDYKLSRDAIVEQVGGLLVDSRVCVIVGDPGAGKSAIAKAAIEKIHAGCDGFVLAFKADELGSGSLNAYFAQFGIQDTLKEIFGLFGLFKHNLIYIDAMEKLLEVDGLAATQLFHAVKDISNVKILVSCRKSDLGMIEFKYLGGQVYVKTEVNVLSDTELSAVFNDLPGLKALADNPRIRSLIRVPKYLDFACRAMTQSGQHFDNITEAAFKEKLWDVIVEDKINGNRDGMPERRGRLLIDIAINRSKAMKPFAPLTTNDTAALNLLLKENIVISSITDQTYAPAHDVLEDWALVKHVDGHFLQNGTSESFFPDLGQSPSMRRAYRLWVQAALQGEQTHKLDFIFRQLFNEKIDTYWRDESLIAILYSAYCPVFFQQYRNELVKDNYQFLFRLIQVMRTACRENIGGLYSKKYLPRGYGWGPVFELLYADLSHIDKSRYDLVYQLIRDWSLIINEQDDVPQPTRTVGLLLLRLLDSHISLDGYRNKEADAAVELLCMFTGGIQPELTAIFNDEHIEATADAASENLYDDDVVDLDTDKLKTKLIKVALSGIAGAQVCKYLPELVIQLCDEYWLLKFCKVVYPESDHQRMMFGITRMSSRVMEQEEQYGLRHEHHFEYSPASAYQTPVLWLLRYHPDKALPFVTELVNWCSENYILSDKGRDEKTSEVTLTLNDGTNVKQCGSEGLWELFRAKSKVAPYLLQSVMMALEKYLLELGEGGIQNAEKLQCHLDFLYRNSHSVATTAVIASLCQAYPVLAGDLLVPLYSDRHPIAYDVTRYSMDYHKHYSFERTVHDYERASSDQLPHRKKYMGGLRGFVNDHSFNYGFANPQLFAWFDHHRKAATADDPLWLKWIDEMDVRTWRYTKEYKDGYRTGFLVEPTYSEDIQPFIDELKAEKEKKDVSDSYSLWLYRVKKKEVEAEPIFWRKIYQYYLDLEKYNIMDDRPAFLAEAAIRYLWADLSAEEKAWCKNTLREIIVQKITNGYRPLEMDMRFSTMDYDAAMDVFPMLTVVAEDGEERLTFEQLALCFLTGPFQENDPDAEDFYKAFREDMWSLNEELAYKALYGLVQFAKFDKENTRNWFRPKTEDDEKAYWDRYDALLERVLAEQTTVSFDDITLEDYSVDYLVRAVKIIPDKTTLKPHFDLVQKLLNLYIKSEFEEKDRQIPEQDRLHTLKWIVEYKMSNLMFWHRTAESNALLKHFIWAAHTIVKIANESKPAKALDFYRLFKEMTEKMVSITDSNLPLENPEIVKATVFAFTATWQKYDELLREFKSQFMGNLILLDTANGWRQDASHWLPIDEEAEQFIGYIKTYGGMHIESVITLLSHIGDQTLLMPMLGWLADQLLTAERAPQIMTYKHMEQLVGRVYYNHLNQLLSDNILLEKYLLLLDKMVEQQSSDAYWLREFLIHLSVERKLVNEVRANKI